MNTELTRRFFVSAASVGAASLAAAGVAGSWKADAGTPSDLSLQAAIASPTRTPSNAARDRYRHPLAALEFFGLRNTQTVIEIEPGAGYWTEILAPYLRAHGKYSAAIPAPVPGKPFTQREWSGFIAKLHSNPAEYGGVGVVTLAADKPLAPPASADLILSFRNLHDWMADGTADAMLSVMYAALKPGGIFGIEDHRGLATQPQDPKAKSGYVREDYALALIEKAGFKLVAKSAIGDNPKDTKDYPKGVWTLPPVLKMGQTDRAKYLAIGESDRWTMKFIKPIKLAGATS